jgi:hypothetical protein
LVKLLLKAAMDWPIFVSVVFLISAMVMLSSWGSAV